MRRRNCNLRFCTVLVAFLGGMIGSTAARAVAEEQPDLLTIQSRLRTLEQLVQTDLAQEAAWKEARQELLALLPASEKLFTAAGGENDPGSPVFKAHAKLLALLAAINARLPDEQATGSYRLSPLPVPRYGQKSVIGKAAEELWVAQQKLVQQAREGGDDSAEFQELLVDMILAEEKLAWEVAWPYTVEEAGNVTTAGQLTGEIYLSRRRRGVERINSELKQTLAGAGREATVPQFVIHSPPGDDRQQEVERRVVERRGEAGKVWMKDTEPFDKAILLAPARRRD